MGKSKRGRASLSLYTPGPLRLNIDLLLWYDSVYYSHWLPQSFLACDYCTELRMAAHGGRSIVLSFHVIKEWRGLAAYGCALRLFDCSSLACDNWMINQSGDFICCYLFFSLFLFVAPGYKEGMSLSWSPHSSPLPSSYLPYPNHHVPCPLFLPAFVQRGCLRLRRCGVDGTGRGSR